MQTNTSLMRRALPVIIAALTMTVLPCFGLAQKPVSRQEMFDILDDLSRGRAGLEKEPLYRCFQAFERDPKNALAAFLDYSVDSDRELYALVTFEFLSPLLAKKFGGQLRPLLLQELRVKEDGELYRDYFRDENQAAAAFRLLSIIDRLEEPISNVRHSQQDQPTRDDAYVAFLRQFRDRLPEAVVEYLFSEFPHDAWIYFYQADLQRSGLSEKQYRWYSHVLMTACWRLDRGYVERVDRHEVKEALSALLNDSAWYSRRYIVHLLMACPSLGDAKVIDRLQGDRHPLVRKRANTLKLMGMGK